MRSRVHTPIDEFLNPGVTAEEAFLFDENEGPASAATIVAESEMENIADAPPEAADYRPAEIEAVACWNCSHFQRTGIGDDNWPTGICHVWEAKVEGQAVCDRFTVDATMGPWPPHKHTGEDAFDPEEFSADAQEGVEFQFASDEAEKDSDGLIWKPILRTGTWPKTPSSKGVVNKALTVVRDGLSSAKDRVISLQEIKDNFEAGAYDYVPIPLTDEENKDHKNLLRLNQGFVKKLKIRDEDNGISKLVAGMNFTEPDTRAKVERRTIPDVSSGIFFGINRPNGKRFNAALNHVVLTHKPFMDGLGAFEFSDGEEIEVETVQLGDDPEGHKVGWPEVLTVEERKARVQTAVDALLSIPEVEDEPNTYTVQELDGHKAVVFSKAAEVAWDVEFSLDDKGVVNVKPVDDWQPQVEASQEEEQPDEPDAAQEENTVPQNEAPLQRARRQRAAVLASYNEGGVNDMGKVRDISQVDFSDAADAQKYAEELSEENAGLRKRTSNADLENRVSQLKDMGFSEMPGVLAYYRDVFLSEDGEPAMVLFSYDDDGNETGRKSKTATELIDGFIASIPTNKEGKILLSGQALDTGNNEPPPESDTDELDNSPEAVEKRTQEAADDLGMDLGGKE